MKRILIADCKQEISSFNPLPSHYENFLIHHGEGLYGQRGKNQELGGALAVFEARPDIEIVPTICARSGSAGQLSAEGWKKLSEEILAAIFAKLDRIDGIYVSLHGAMDAKDHL